MTPEQADQIRNSFDAMWSMSRDIGELCYGRFFELSPEARDLFPGDMELQRIKLMNMMPNWSARSISPRCFSLWSCIPAASTPDLGFSHRNMRRWARR